MFKVKNIMILLLCIALTLACGCYGDSISADIITDGTLSADYSSDGDFPEESLNEYILAAKNEKYSLYFERKGLTVLVRDEITGTITSSSAQPDEGASNEWKNFVNSGISIEYFKDSATTLNKLNLYSGSAEIKVTAIKNGFAADINFKSVGISFTELVTLSESGIEVKLPNSSLKENNEKFKLAAVYVLPFLGNTHLGDTPGYIFIPDGCGALISLKDNNEKFSQPYCERVYGENFSIQENSKAVQQFESEIATMADTAGIYAPVFGMIHTDDNTGFLGIIENGKYNAEICAYPNGVVTDYNWVTARYIYRDVYFYPTSKTGGISTVQELRETFDISVRYDFVNGENANYVGLAKAYRNYLSDKGILNNFSDSYSLRADIFAGDVEKSLFGTSFIDMTTVSETGDIIDDMISNGTERITLTYKGWQKNGIYGVLSGSLAFQRSLGSFSDFKKLSEKYKDSVKMILYGDLLNTYKKSGSYNYIYRCNGKIFSDETFLELHPQKYRYTSQRASELIKQYGETLSKTGIFLAADGVTSECYSVAADEKHMYSRKSFADSIVKAFNDSENATGIYYAPNDYLWKNTDDYFDFKLYGSDYKFVSEEIPFFAIVLRGSMTLHSEYVNFKADSTEYLLKMIESGIYPSFLLTSKSPSGLIYSDSSSLYSCEYSEYSEMIKKYNEIFMKLGEAIGNASIENFSKQGGVSTVTYSNGSVVIVNFNNCETETSGVVIPAHSYSVKAGEQ